MHSAPHIKGEIKPTLFSLVSSSKFGNIFYQLFCSYFWVCVGVDNVSDKVLRSGTRALVDTQNICPASPSSSLGRVSARYLGTSWAGFTRYIGNPETLMVMWVNTGLGVPDSCLICKGPGWGCWACFWIRPFTHCHVAFLSRQLIKHWQIRWLTCACRHLPKATDSPKAPVTKPTFRWDWPWDIAHMLTMFMYIRTSKLRGWPKRMHKHACAQTHTHTHTHWEYWGSKVVLHTTRTSLELDTPSAGSPAGAARVDAPDFNRRRQVSWAESRAVREAKWGPQAAEPAPNVREAMAVSRQWSTRTPWLSSQGLVAE